MVVVLCLKLRPSAVLYNFIPSSLAGMAANTALLLLLLSTARAGRHERRLLNDLLFSYNSMELSANNEADSVDCIVDFK